LIEAYVFIRYFLRQSVLGKPAIQKLERGRLGLKTFSIQIATVMVRDKTITCLSVKPLKTKTPG
jgi:hypothetical protein